MIVMIIIAMIGLLFVAKFLLGLVGDGHHLI